jgi:nucleoid-associated protein YgaU
VTLRGEPEGGDDTLSADEVTIAPAPTAGDTPPEPRVAEPPTDDAVAAPPEPDESRPQPPSFDQIRVAPDGSTVVAGRAPSGSDVSLRLDGEEIAVVRAAGDGGFASIFTLQPSDAPRIMSLLATTREGVEVGGVESVIIAPFGMNGGRDVAAAESGAQPASSDGTPAPRQAPGTDALSEEVAAADATRGRRPAQEEASSEGSAVAPELAEASSEDGTAPVQRAADETSGNEEIPATGELELADVPGEETPEAGAPGTSADSGDSGEATESVAEGRAHADAPAAQDSASVPFAPDVQPPPDVDGAERRPPEAEARELAEVTAPSADAPPPDGTVAASAPQPDVAADVSEPTTPATGLAPETEVARAPSVVIAGPDGLRVMQGAETAPEGGTSGATPRPQTDVQLDAIAYDREGAVILSGSGPADAQLRVLLNNQPVELGEIGPEGEWSLDLPDVDPGTYTLTVAQLSPEGEVESRVDTPFLREDPARIAANPMLVGPGVSVITVQPGFTLWGIAEANFGEGVAYVQIFERNRDRIRDPHWIYPGQIFRLPDLPRVEDTR